MFDTLVDDLLDIVVSHLANPKREIDDIAKDAAVLTMVGSVETTKMAKKLWMKVVDLASLMHPCPHQQCLESKCTSNSLTKADAVKFAKACGIYKSWYSIDDIKRRVERNDAQVGVHCPIPQSAAFYVLHMICRCMPSETASVVFKGKDLNECRKYRSAYRFSDLRRAKDAVPVVEPVVQERKNEILKIEELFGETMKRPWWVRTVKQALMHIRTQKLIQEGFTVDSAQRCCEWDPEVMQRYKEITALLKFKLGGNSLMKHGPDWHSLSSFARYRIPAIFHRCSDSYLNYNFTTDDILNIWERARLNAEKIAHVPIEIQKDALEKVFPRGIPLPMRLLVNAILLNAQSLPANTVYWGIDDFEELVKQATWAKKMSASMGVFVGPDLKEFKARLRAVLT